MGAAFDTSSSSSKFLLPLLELGGLIDRLFRCSFLLLLLLERRASLDSVIFERGGVDIGGTNPDIFSHEVSSSKIGEKR